MYYSYTIIYKECSRDHEDREWFLVPLWSVFDAEISSADATKEGLFSLFFSSRDPAINPAG